MTTEQIYNGLRLIAQQRNQRFGVCKRCCPTPTHAKFKGANLALVLLYGEEMCKMHVLQIIEEGD